MYQVPYTVELHMEEGGITWETLISRAFGFRGLQPEFPTEKNMAAQLERHGAVTLRCDFPRFGERETLTHTGHRC